MHKTRERVSESKHSCIISLHTVPYLVDFCNVNLYVGELCPRQAGDLLQVQTEPTRPEVYLNLVDPIVRDAYAAGEHANALKTCFPREGHTISPDAPDFIGGRSHCV